MPTRVGLMGLGRIGRNIFRLLYRSDRFRIEAISDVADHAALAYLLRFDTILGRFPEAVSLKDGHLYAAGRQIAMLSGAEPGDVEIGCGVLAIGTSSIRLGAAAFKDGACIATAEMTVVQLDGSKPAPIAAVTRNALDAYAIAPA